MKDSYGQPFSVGEVMAVPVAESTAECLLLGHVCSPFPLFFCSLAWLGHISSPDAL